PRGRFVGLNVWRRRRRRQFVVGEITGSIAFAYLSNPAMKDRHVSLIPFGSPASPNTLSPESASSSDMCVWHPLPAESAHGLLMNVARYPSLRAISLTPFLNVKPRSGPASPRRGAKLISHCEPAYSQFDV